MIFLSYKIINYILIIREREIMFRKKCIWYEVIQIINTTPTIIKLLLQPVYCLLCVQAYCSFYVCILNTVYIIMTVCTSITLI